MARANLGCLLDVVTLEAGALLENIWSCVPMPRSMKGFSSPEYGRSTFCHVMPRRSIARRVRSLMYSLPQSPLMRSGTPIAGIALRRIEAVVCADAVGVRIEQMRRERT